MENNSAGSTLYKCGTCGEAYYSLPLLLNHLNTHHKDDSPVRNRDDGHQSANSGVLSGSIFAFAKPGMETPVDEVPKAPPKQQKAKARTKQKMVKHSRAAVRIPGRKEVAENDEQWAKRQLVDEKLRKQYGCSDICVHVPMLSREGVEAAKLRIKQEAAALQRTERIVRCALCDITFFDKHVWSLHMSQHAKGSSTRRWALPASSTGRSPTKKSPAKTRPLAKSAVRQMPTGRRRRVAPAVSAGKARRGRPPKKFSFQQWRKAKEKRQHKKDTEPVVKAYFCSYCPAKFLLAKSLDSHKAKAHGEVATIDEGILVVKSVAATQIIPDEPVVIPEEPEASVEPEATSPVQVTRSQAVTATEVPSDPFRCVVCKRVFQTKFGLDKHMKMAHKIRELPKSPAGKSPKSPKSPVVSPTVAVSSKSPVRQSPQVTADEVVSSGSGTHLPVPALEPEDAEQSEDEMEQNSSEPVEMLAPPAKKKPRKSADAGDDGKQETQSKGSVSRPGACDICGLVFKQAASMSRHQEVHKRYEAQVAVESSDRAKFVPACHTCRLVFKTTTLLSQHKASVHKKKPSFACTQCSDQFRTRAHLVKHEMQEHAVGQAEDVDTDGHADTRAGDADEEHTCMVCPARFTERDHLLTHLHTKHNILNLEAVSSELGKRSVPPKPSRVPPPLATRKTGRAAGKRNLRTSQAPVAGAPKRTPKAEKSVCRTSCQFCGMVLTKPSNLCQHMKLAHNVVDFTATVESTGMPSFILEVHGDVFTWTCCEIKFHERTTFIHHRRSKHGNPREMAGASSTASSAGVSPGRSGARRCEQCSIEFKTVSAFRQHQTKHMKHACRICQRSFGSTQTDLAQFRAHLRSHEAEGYTIHGIENIRPSRAGEPLPPLVYESPDEDSETEEYLMAEDDVSIFSSSGVESEVEEDGWNSDGEDESLITTCPVCEKRFACIYRFQSHWKLHCANPVVTSVKPSLKTRAFSYFSLAKSARTKYCYVCLAGCQRRFSNLLARSLHFQTCHNLRTGRRKRKLAPTEEPSGPDSETGTERFAPVAGIFESSVAEADLPVPGAPLALTPRKLIGSPEKRAFPSKAAGEGKTTDGTEPHAHSEYEDTLDFRAGTQKSRAKCPQFVEKAYVVEWDASRTAEQKPHKCLTCGQEFADFVGIIMHIKSHITHPITESDGKAGVVQATAIQIRGSGNVPPKKYPCQLCGQRFDFSKDLEEHKETHKKKKTFRCGHCRRRFWTSDQLTQHEKRSHALSGNKCGTCGKCFRGPAFLEKHMAAHEIENSIYQCEGCNLSFYGLKSLMKHFADAHESVRIQRCWICHKICTDLPALLEHVKGEHSADTFSCRLCRKRFRNPIAVAQHAKRIHTLHRQSVCGLCEKEFSSRQLLTLHLWRHTCDKSYQCRICEKSFDSESETQDHIIFAHPYNSISENIIDTLMVYGFDEETLKESRSYFQCYVCGKHFGSKLQVRAHVDEKHRRPAPEPCRGCLAQFRTAFALRKHSETCKPDMDIADVPISYVFDSSHVVAGVIYED